MKLEEKIRLIRLLVTIGLLQILNIIWQLLELLFYSEIQPRVVDSLIAYFIAISIYYNVKYWII